MILRLFTVLAVLAAALVSGAGTACACSCAPFKAAEAMANASAVFTGTVVSSRRVAGDPLGPRPPIIYTIRADHVYKGEVGQTFEVATNVDSAACGYQFDQSARYLVFAAKGESGLFAIDPGVALNTSLCSGNRQISPGAGPLAAGQSATNGEPVTQELITALGTARPVPKATTTPAAASSPSPAPWIWLLAIIALAAAAWGFAHRRRA